LAKTYAGTVFDSIPVGASVPLTDLYAALPIEPSSIRRAAQRCVAAGALTCSVDHSCRMGPEAVTYSRSPDATPPADGRGRRGGK